MDRNIMLIRRELTIKSEFATERFHSKQISRDRNLNNPKKIMDKLQEIVHTINQELDVFCKEIIETIESSGNKLKIQYSNTLVSELSRITNNLIDERGFDTSIKGYLKDLELKYCSVVPDRIQAHNFKIRISAIELDIRNSISRAKNSLRSKCEIYAESLKVKNENTHLVNNYVELNSPLKNQNNVIVDFNSETISAVWTKMLNRVESDWDGAITLSRSLLESVCKHILDDKSIQYSKTEELSSLYKMTAKSLKLAVEQHDEQIIKNILGACSSIVKGIAEYRNIHGDSHGKSKNHSSPYVRHVRLVVNASATLCLFLIETFNYRKEQGA